MKKSSRKTSDKTFTESSTESSKKSSKKNLPQVFTKKLLNYYTDEKCHLNWDKNRPWTLLFAVILSAQCTDKQVNKITPNLFLTFPDLESYVAKPIDLLEEAVHSTGFYRNKAKNIKQCAEQLLLDFEGKVPNTMKDLTALAGVGRKTANVILWNLFEKNIGFVVDTHVGRITQRFGLTQQTSPEKIEKDLMKVLPQEHWGGLSHRLVQLGRDFCIARKPKCGECFFETVCPKKINHS